MEKIPRLEDEIYNVDLSNPDSISYLMSSRELIRTLLGGVDQHTVDRITRRCRDNMGEITGLPEGFEYFGPIQFTTYVFNSDKPKHFISTHQLRTKEGGEAVYGPQAETAIKSVKNLFYKLVEIQKPYLGLSPENVTDVKARYMLSLFGVK